MLTLMEPFKKAKMLELLKIHVSKLDFPLLTKQKYLAIGLHWFHLQ